MQIELVAPATEESALLPRLGLGILAALTPPEDEVVYTDEVVSPIDPSAEPKDVDLVAISVDSKTARRSYDIAAAYRRVANEEDIQSVLGLEVHGSDVTTGTLDAEGYRDVAERVVREFGVSQVAITLRESRSASENGWSAVLFEGSGSLFHRSQQYDISVVDRLGGGDSFAAGLIYGLITGRPADAALRFAVAASAIKHSIPGDFNRVTVAEVDRLAGGDASGRVQR